MQNLPNSQGYIFHTVEHFTTKLCNFTQTWVWSSVKFGVVIGKSGRGSDITLRNHIALQDNSPFNSPQSVLVEAL